MKKLFLLLVAVFASATLMAQTSTVVVKLLQPNSSPAANVSVNAKKAKDSAKSDADGMANIRVAVKDELVVKDPRFYEVSVSIKNWNPADTIIIPLTFDEEYEEEASDEKTVHVGKFSSYGTIYEAVKAACPMLKVYGECVVSNRNSDDSECALIVVDNKIEAKLSDVVLSEVDSIEFLQSNQASIYGIKAKYGALVVTTVATSMKPLHKQ